MKPKIYKEVRNGKLQWRCMIDDSDVWGYGKTPKGAFNAARRKAKEKQAQQEFARQTSRNHALAPWERQKSRRQIGDPGDTRYRADVGFPKSTS